MAVNEHPDTREAAEARLSLVGEYPADARSVRAARDAVAELATRSGAAPATVEDIRLAISEAATNAVMHAYQGHADGTFRVYARVGDQQILVIVEDDGCGLSHPAATPGLGAGLRVMRQVAQAAIFRERENGGSTVQLSFALDA